MTYFTQRPTLLGALTLWPMLYIGLFVVVWLAAFASMSSGSPAAADGMLVMWAVIAPLHILTMVLTFGLIAFYITHLVQNEALGDTQKVLWALVVLMGAPIGPILYYWMNVRNTPTAVAG